MQGKVEKSCGENDKHDGDITCISYYNGYVFSGGADGTIKIWDEDLNLINTLQHHFASHIYALCINKKGKLYSSSNDGLVKYMENPLKSTESHNLMTSDDCIQCLYCDGDKFYTGDDIGVVTMWENDRILFKFNIVEEVKSMVVENNLIYTVRDLDVTVTEIMAGKSGRYTTKATVPGKSPMILLGPINDGRRAFLAFCSRDGRGLNVVDNGYRKCFVKIWSKDDCHEMIVNSLCGTEKTLFSAGYDKTVKMWTEIDKTGKLVGEVNIGSCVNYICNGPNDHTVFTATSDGIVRRVGFS